MKAILYLIILLILTSCSQVQSDATANDASISISEINDFLKPETQIFGWSTKNDTIITCEQGTKIYLPKGCMDPTSFDKGKPVTIEIKECYQLSEFVSEGLTTLSQGKILETGGMVHIDVKQEGKPVKLKKDSEYGLLFPKDGSSSKTMQTFYGNTIVDEKITWELDTNSVQQQEANAKSSDLLLDCEFELGWYTGGFDDDSDIGWVLNSSNEHVPSYILDNLKPSRKLIDKFCETQGTASYDLWYNLDGTVKQIDIEKSVSAEFDSLFTKFVRRMPPIKVGPLTKKYINRSYMIGFETYQRSKYSDEDYAQKFKEKYASIKDEVVSKVDKAELDYYVLAASEFGWINCDRFWETEDEKIDFIVDVENLDAVNLNLVFSDINSIMPAIRIGDKYVFKNVPIGRNVKLVGIGYEGESARLAVQRTKTSKKGLKLSGFENFKLAELEKELNSI